MSFALSMCREVVVDDVPARYRWGYVDGWRERGDGERERWRGGEGGRGRVASELLRGDLLFDDIHRSSVLSPDGWPLSGSVAGRGRGKGVEREGERERERKRERERERKRKQERTHA